MLHIAKDDEDNHRLVGVAPVSTYPQCVLGLNAHVYFFALHLTILTSGAFCLSLLAFYSGDSSGNVQFWDGKFGTLLARFSQHQADVLQLAVSPDGNMVFAAGWADVLQWEPMMDNSYCLLVVHCPHKAC